MSLRIIELFGGIGASTKALKKLGVDIEVLDYVEINPQAVKSYNAINDTDYEPQDITKWDKKFDDVDIVFHGSPCQDFSTAGKQLGGKKGSGTRSSLLFETVRIIENILPKVVVWENVKNAISEKHRPVVDEYLDYLNGLGYESSMKLTMASYYGIPQDRERVFIVSILGGLNGFEFEEEVTRAENLQDYLSFRLSDDLTNNFYNRYRLKINPDATMKEFVDYINNLPISRGLGTMKMGIYDFNEMDTITTIHGRTGTLTCRNVQNYNKKYWYDNRLFKPSPLMCWRLMGFDYDDYIKAADVVEEKDLYNQAGNSIVVNVLESILERVLKAIN